jgi:Asp-tRNA(Asn)/Glu-tRNA(Gln) amidotransferase A subunit family amidase
MKDLCYLSASELSKGISSGEILSEDLVKSYIDRIKKFDKTIKAWAHFDPQYILDKAIEADDYRKLGRPIGPLHGLPIAIKDIFGTKDMPTGCGTPLRTGKHTKNDSEAVNLLRISGALMMGKTVTTEFAYFDPGKTTNPHDESRTPGGSSSGSAAAVASFMAPVAIGSQTNGSVIRPASYCGVIGYKPTYGLISRSGVLKQSHLLDHVGVFARTIEDIAFITKEIVKRDTKDSSTVPYSVANIVETSQEEPPFEPNFVFFKTDHWKNMDKDAAKSFESFLKKYKNNIKVVDEPSYFKEAFKYHQIIHETDMAHSFSDYYRNAKKKLGKKLVEAIERGMKYSAQQYVEACENRDYFYNLFHEVFHDYHAVLTPATTGVAPKGLKYTGSPEFCTVWTYLGMPALSLPLLSGSNNLPLGIQIVGEKFDDPRLLRTANWLMNKVKGGKND